MENTRKQKFIDFVQFTDDAQLIGVYYLDKLLNIIHYSIYSFEDRARLIDEIKKLDDGLEDDLIKIHLWLASESKDYLIGVYDGLVKDQGTMRVE